MIYARLISQGKDHGVQAFLVQVRCLQTHKPLQGIEVGDIGPKIAFHTTDNGYLKFTYFRQPSDSLLSRYVTLSADGTFTKDPNATKLAYGGMLNLRISIHHSVHSTIAKMATIASRYSFLRRQFDSKEGKGKPETLIMQYQMQQVKIVPSIAATWAHLITNISMQQ